MANTLKIKSRPVAGGAGAPATLAVGELAYNETSGALYIGTSAPGVAHINNSTVPANITTLSGLTLGVNYVIMGDAGSTFASLQLTTGTFLGRSGSGTVAAKPMSDDAFAFVAAADNAAMRTALGVAIGSNVQAWDAHLDSLAGLTTPVNSICVGAGAGSFAMLDIAANQFPARKSTGALTAIFASDFFLDNMAVPNIDTWFSNGGFDDLVSLAYLAATPSDIIVGDTLNGFGKKTIAANEFFARASTGAANTKTITDLGLALLDDSTDSAMRSTLGLDTFAVQNTAGVSVNVTFDQNVFFAGAGFSVTGAAATMGYGTGAGGTVTQITSKSTTVTLNKPTGIITTHNAALGIGGIVSFTLSNSTVTANDTFAYCHDSGGTIGAYAINIRATGAGTAQVTITNISGGSLSQAISIRYAVIDSANN